LVGPVRRLSQDKKEPAEARLQTGSIVACISV
jgi:hypothetical protein